ncbi:MAG: B12-binding domain-containing radical SAM protein [Candidatus Bathyarchaeota archaeon]|nr:B12-binding domain-containing radical SAM protein [Candidatus Bathyarchaeota archaeon]
MRFCLVSVSPNEGIDPREARKSIAAFPPLSILYLAAVLEQAGAEVAVLDQPGLGLTVDETVAWILRQEPDVVGFSALASSGQTAALLSSKIKQKRPDTIVVFGNHYATFNAKRILAKYPQVDVVVRGEGEKTVTELALSVENGENFNAVKGITFRRNGEVVENPDQPLIKNIDELPFPNRGLLDVDYHCLMAGANVAPKKFTSIVTSRGCVYSCRFCSCTQIAKNLWRPRSAKNTLEELKLLYDEGYRQLIFVDDSFTLNPKRAIEICRGMRKEKLDFEWICEGRVDNCSYELVYEMVKAGLKILYFGIENANPRILNYYNKTITPQQAENAVRTAKKAGVDVIVGSFIVGAPTETRKEIQNTIDFAKRVPIDLPQFNILGAHPGNDIWNEFMAKGLLREEVHWETGVGVCTISPNTVPQKEIREMIHAAFYQHVRRPLFLLDQLARTIRSPWRRHIILSNLPHIADIREGTQNVT